MSKLLRRHTRVACFFCQSEVSPRDPQSFRCPSCQCWNRYDANNEIISEEPAMHDENLNAKSFARRASPRKDRFPTIFGNTLFCHTCQTNQMLGSNILSNYLPSPNHPDYNAKLQTLPAYRESVELRYPPVCADCLPAVEEEIRRRDTMARVSALGGFLKDSKGKGKQRVGDTTQAQRDKLDKSLFMWRIRGALWVITLVGTVSVYMAVALDYSFPLLSTFLGPTNLVWTVVSVFWAAWDPTYATKKRDELQGRSVRQLGKRKYNIMQTFVWLSRLTTSIMFTIPRYYPSQDYIHLRDSSSSITRLYCCVLLFLECSIVVASIVVLQLQRTPALHLVDAFSHRPSLTPSLSSSRAGTPGVDSASLSSLSISQQPVPPSSLSNPIFGLPSLSTKSHPPEPITNGDLFTQSVADDDYDDDKERDPNAMDWSPTIPSPAKRNQLKRDNNGFILRPPRFYAPEEPTGLENLFEQTIKLADSGDEQPGIIQKSAMRVVDRRETRWRWLTGITVCALAVGFGIWWQRDRWIVLRR